MRSLQPRSRITWFSTITSREFISGFRVVCQSREHDMNWLWFWWVNYGLFSVGSAGTQRPATLPSSVGYQWLADFPGGESVAVQACVGQHQGGPWPISFWSFGLAEAGAGGARSYLAKTCGGVIFSSSFFRDDVWRLTQLINIPFRWRTDGW